MTVRRARRPRLAHVALLCAGSVGAIFLGYELLERAWILKAHPAWCPLLHQLRGIGAALLAASLATSYLLRRTGPLFADEAFVCTYAPSEAFSRRHAGQEGCRQHAQWLIQTRWAVLFVGVTLVIAGARAFPGLLPAGSVRGILLCLGALLAVNVLLAASVGRWRDARSLLLGQMLVDLAALTVCMAFSGGIENPLVVLAPFHVTLSAVLLPRREALWIATAAAALLVAVAAGETLGVWRHVSLGLPFREDGAHGAPDLLHASARLLPLVLLLFAMAGVVTLVMGRLHASEVGLARAAQMASIGELAGRVAHEVNNPAGIIKAKARLLTMDLDQGLQPPALRGELDKIAQQAGRIGEITQGLLSFCRPSVGEKTFQDLNAITRDVLGLVDHTLRSGGIRLRMSLAVGLPPVHGNRGELRQVLLNLVTNAIDAMPKGGLLTVETSLEEDDGASWADVTVADTGPGIPPGDLERIFLPFYTTKAEGRGTGLGLSVSQGLVLSHGGEIQVESAPGKGSRFLVRLPVSMAVADRTAANMPVAKKEDA